MPMSCTARIFGCVRAAAACASCSKRASRSGSLEKAAGRILIATSRLSRVSRARYTSPIPPAPRGARISYGPRRVPGPRDMGCQEDGAIVDTMRHRLEGAWLLRSQSWLTEKERNDEDHDPSA